ncbi:glycoside hydrolase family 31 protein [Lentisphaera marina]|uniref:glycoside hydrolase family 31 protein n=1 Tax=Lentisphaera marina TaxID=1111041 RepID=UPI002367342E|nr:glycoside hydrolase family 31 protein [Lentisphaera marina]MDD7986175.1 glycoside hydrolase family 31 protein [Lentisphaera marina]
MKKLLFTLAALGAVAAQAKDKEYKVEIPLEKGEAWWGGLSVDGHKMPYLEETNYTRDLLGNNYGNQAQPLLVSNTGRYVWCEEPMKYEYKSGKLVVSSQFSEIKWGDAGDTLKDAYEYSSKNFFPTDGKIPDELLFTEPQYNTWIELMYDQNEEDILEYAQKLIDQGYPPGVLMIDDNWQENYGVWEFSAKRFKDPKGMIEKLHKMGFKVMMWVCPFVTADSATYRYLAQEDLLLRDPGKTQNILWANTSNKPAIVRWWNGASACLDLSNPKAMDWFKDQLDHLVEEYGVDGFKFDAGDARFYKKGVVSKNHTHANDHTIYFSELGLHYPLNEYRASWKLAGRPLAQRLRDKKHNWGDMQQLIPGIIAQGLMGYAFTCPDMIGGGEYQSFLKTDSIDEELVVRSAQCSALMPMMQFSAAPWRVLSPENAKICKDMAKLHSKLGQDILAMAKKSAKTGEPIVKSLEYLFPEGDYEKIQDQFILGDKIMVAPVLAQGARSREVVFPRGTWKGDDGSTVVGPTKVTINVPLERLPWYEKVQDSTSVASK